jgi:hypothetical protein
MTLISRATQTLWRCNPSSLAKARAGVFPSQSGCVHMKGSFLVWKVLYVRRCKLNECAIDFKNHTNMMHFCRGFTGKGHGCGPNGTSFTTIFGVHTLPFIVFNSLALFSYINIGFHVPLSRISLTKVKMIYSLSPLRLSRAGHGRGPGRRGYAGWGTTPFSLAWNVRDMSIRNPLTWNGKTVRWICVKRSKMNILVWYNTGTHGLEWNSGNGLEGCSPLGLYYGYIDSEIIKHVIITNLVVVADDITL